MSNYSYIGTYTNLFSGAIHQNPGKGQGPFSLFRLRYKKDKQIQSRDNRENRRRTRFD